LPFWGITNPNFDFSTGVIDMKLKEWNPALFSLNMLLGTARGQSYSEEQITAMPADIGVGDIRRLPLMGPTESSIIAGKKLVRA
jgi:hypothetical protein